jgi:hypothetical protein
MGVLDRGSDRASGNLLFFIFKKEEWLAIRSNQRLTTFMLCIRFLNPELIFPFLFPSNYNPDHPFAGNLSPLPGDSRHRGASGERFPGAGLAFSRALELYFIDVTS